MAKRERVVTWQSATGEKRDVCRACEAEIRARSPGEWMRDWTGEEFATVSHGLHAGTCDVCLSRSEVRP